MFESFKEKGRIKRMEAEMPFKLRTLGMLLNMRVGFYEALEKISAEEGEFSKELAKQLEGVKKGEELGRALGKMAEADSQVIKRAVSQLITAYEHGSRGDEIKRIGNELLAIQQYKIREYSSKSAVFGLLFIMLSVVIPAFAIIISAIGGMLFETAITFEMLEAAVLVLVPALSILVLALIRYQAPETIFGGGAAPNLIPLVFAGAMVALVASGLMNWVVLAVVGIAFLILFYKEYLKERAVESIENSLPDALLDVSTLPPGSSVESVFRRLSRNGNKDLASEFEKSWRQVKANVRLDRVLDDLKERVKTGTMGLTANSMKSIMEMNYIRGFNELAEDLLRFFEIRRERDNTMGMQKYTMLAGAVLIPLILSLSLNLLSNISEYMGQGIDIGRLAGFLIPAYLIIYCTLISYFIAGIEGRGSRALVYSFGATLLSLTLFYILMS